MGIKIGNFDIDRPFIFAAIQSLFICVGIILAVVIGRLSMAQEIRVLLDYSCEGTRIQINEDTNTVIVTEGTPPLVNPDYWANFTTTTIPS